MFSGEEENIYASLRHCQQILGRNESRRKKDNNKRTNNNSNNNNSSGGNSARSAEETHRDGEQDLDELKLPDTFQVTYWM